MRKSNGPILSWLMMVVILLGGIWFFWNSRSLEEKDSSGPTAVDPMSTYCVDLCRIENNEYFANMLQSTGIDPANVYSLIENTKEEFDPRQFRAGKRYEVLYDKVEGTPEFLRYPLDIQTDLEYDLQNLCVTKCLRELDTVIQRHSGVIESSLWLAMQKSEIPIDLIDKMESVFAWTIDFYHIQKGDRFKLVYEALYDGEERVGTGRILGALFETSGKENYAIRYATESYDGFFDLEARPMKRAFLKAPVKYSRISSRYSPRRFHPVLKRNKAHLGTDYAAPTGTPIYAVANGVITKATFTRNNGLFVKIKHSEQIQTQYLHMSKIGKGISPGVHVKQGEVIGYVGMTGLATGPHVCFRFWKNGKQVDHLRENLPPPEPMKEEDKPFFYTLRDSIKIMIDEIPYIEEVEMDSDSIPREADLLM